MGALGQDPFKRAGNSAYNMTGMICIDVPTIGRAMWLETSLDSRKANFVYSQIRFGSRSLELA